MYDTSHLLQSLLGKQITLQEFITKVNDDYTASLKKKVFGKLFLLAYRTSLFFLLCLLILFCYAASFFEWRV